MKPAALYMAAFLFEMACGIMNNTADNMERNENHRVISPRITVLTHVGISQKSAFRTFRVFKH